MFSECIERNQWHKLGLNAENRQKELNEKNEIWEFLWFLYFINLGADFKYVVVRTIGNNICKSDRRVRFKCFLKTSSLWVCWEYVNTWWNIRDFEICRLLANFFKLHLHDRLPNGSSFISTFKLTIDKIRVDLRLHKFAQSM